MVATVVVQEVTGSAGSKTYTTITNRVRLFTVDQATNQSTPQTDYPVPIPAAGFNYSYWKHVCLDITGSGFTIDNIRHYSDGTIGWNFGTGGELRRGNLDTPPIGCTTAGYEQAAGTAGTTGYSIEDGANGHDFYNGESTPTVDVESDTAPDGVVVDAGPYTSATKTKMIVLQVKVDTDATQGTQTAETGTFVYDEQ